MAVIAATFAATGGVFSWLALSVAAWPVVLLTLGGTSVLIGAAAAAIALNSDLVDTDPRIDGQPIAGEGLRLLSDIDNRFAHAEKSTGEIDGGVEWREIQPAVDALRWQAALEAAALTRASENYDELVHAPDGSAMAALRRELDADRAVHLAALHRIQRIADDLYRQAANTVAAQAIAIRRGGYRRDIVLPRLSDGEAESRIESASARLLALEAALVEVDDSTTLLAERLRAEAPTESEHPESG